MPLTPLNLTNNKNEILILNYERIKILFNVSVVICCMKTQWTIIIMSKH
jgi:hypothetical protein